MPRRERKTDSIWRVPGMSILLSPGVSDPTKALCVHLYTRWRARAHASCVSMCAAVCGVSSFIRSLRDAQVFYNVATGARVPVSYLRPSHFSTRYIVSKSREKVSVVRPSLSNFHGKTIASNPERTRP